MSENAFATFSFFSSGILSGLIVTVSTVALTANTFFPVVGFCGSDNQGLDGIEAKYEEILKGSKGL